MTSRRSIDNTEAAEPTLRVSGPAELIQLVPYLMGFHPKQSLVVLGLARGSIVVTVRIDLADLIDGAPRGVLAGSLAAMVRGGARDLIGIVFDNRAVPDSAATAPLPWHGLRDALVAEADRSGAEVSDVLLVSRHRWWSYSCSGSACCPPEGTELDDESSAIHAAAAYAGMVALPDRAALAALLEPVADADRDSLLPRLREAEAALREAPGRAGAERSAKRALFAAARAADVPGCGVTVSEDDLVRFGAALATDAVRNAAWLAVDDERVDGRELWRCLGRRLPGSYAAGPLFVFGWASWRAGDGALARIAAQRALDADPACTAADLLLAAVGHGFDPRQVPKLRRRTA